MYPQTNLKPGQSGPEVKRLQEFLISQGYNIPSGATSYFGNETKAALTSWQREQGVDAGNDYGYWGPKSKAVASSASTRSNQPYTEEEYTAAIARNPIASEFIKRGNTAEDLEYAATTGDFSSIVNQYGQPFSLEEQKKAMEEAEKDTEEYFRQEKEKDLADTEATIKEKQRQFQDYLITSGESFEEDKSKADQTAANQGVLFSGSRVQKENDLKTRYERDQASKRAAVGADIGSTVRGFQYNYGDDAIGGLSDFYRLGENVYNPKVATGGVSTGSLSSVYDPNKYSFQGTKVVEKKAAASTRAAKLLANRGNKLLSSGYLNQL